MKKIWNMILYILILKPVSEGFTVPMAKQWINRVVKDLRSNTHYGLRKKIKAYKLGYLPQYLDRFNVDKANKYESISERDYTFLQPLNGNYRKWIANKVISKKIFSVYRSFFPEYYYQITVKNKKIIFTPLEDCKEKGRTLEDFIKFVKEKSRVVITVPNGRYSELLRYEDGSFFSNDEEMKLDDFVKKIKKYGNEIVVAEYVEPHDDYKNQNNAFGQTLSLIVCNKNGRTPIVSDAFLRMQDEYNCDFQKIEREIKGFYQEEIDLYKETDSSFNILNQKDYDVTSKKYFQGIISYIDTKTGKYEGGYILGSDHILEIEKDFKTNLSIMGVVPHWKEIIEQVKNLCLYVPQLQFFQIDILITEKGFLFKGFKSEPQYPRVKMFDKETIDFLYSKLEEKQEAYQGLPNKLSSAREKIFTKLRKFFASAFFPKGLIPYLSLRWIKEVIVDFFVNKDISISKKLWAYKRGFLSYRIDQYGITKDNYLDFISDFEYKWLRHINSEYRILLEDKITIKYLFRDFKNAFPEYYYHIRNYNGENVMIPMMDCPAKYSNSYDDIFSLLKEKKELALKPDEGSHGDGFYKLSYNNGKYFLNFDEASKKQVMEILNNPKNQYLVTEYIQNNKQFKEIYAGAVNTIRMIVFKKDGVTPSIGNAYMRFGSKATGAVDNMGAGGMFVQVDIDTGAYGNAKIITKNSIKDCPYHPDSGVLIEGYIPHWELIKSKVLEIANSIEQLEYFGFDIAVTEDGIKLPEINRFPDYPKIEKLSPVTTEYLLHKLEEKKAYWGYDKKPCRKLIRLPRR